MKQLSRAFKQIKSIEPPTHLESVVLNYINEVRLRQIKRKLIISKAGFLGSVLAIFYSLFSFGQPLIKSEFWSVVSLVFSDANVVMSNWQDFAYSTMENFPTISLILILLPVMIFFISIAVYFSNHKKISQLSRRNGPLAAC